MKDFEMEEELDLFGIIEDQCELVGGNYKEVDFGRLKKNYIEVCLKWRDLFQNMFLVIGSVYREVG